MYNRKIIVSLSLNNKNIKVGTLWFHIKGKKESASFEYDKEWLINSEKFALEPALSLAKGTYQTKQGSLLFGAFGDSAPDRWGRMLMLRQERAQAKEHNRVSRTLFEVDYLL